MPRLFLIICRDLANVSFAPNWPSNFSSPPSLSYLGLTLRLPLFPWQTARLISHTTKHLFVASWSAPHLTFFFFPLCSTLVASPDLYERPISGARFRILCLFLRTTGHASSLISFLFLVKVLLNEPGPTLGYLGIFLLFIRPNGLATLPSTGNSSKPFPGYFLSHGNDPQRRVRQITSTSPGVFPSFSFHPLPAFSLLMPPVVADM